jgi:secondary thiamine-phosphate synthase enzyme
MEKLNVKTKTRIELVDITQLIQDAITKSKIKEGVCFVFCPHTTAGLTINENADPAVVSDMKNTLSKLVPQNAGYSHAEGNSDSHIKTSLLGSSLSVFVEDGRIALGSWQGIFFCENDGPRARELWVKII